MNPEHPSVSPTLDKTKVGELLESYRPWCRVFVRQRLFSQLGRRLDDSDVIQMAWVDVVRNLTDFQGESEAEFFAWLKKILDNRLKNVIRDNMADKRDFREEQDCADVMNSASLNWWQPTDPGSTPSNRAINGDSALRLAEAIESLPTNQRTAIELRYLQGLKLREVCKAMDKTSDAVVSLLRRGMQKLETVLAESTNR